ncbi:hypothetical protein [Lentzea flava]|uniref:SUKH-3 immunity protein n=1 Tax=Lentzea flava TaxID=103732 RepID=A0ABQ2USE2_9PSEU|nr:hypothetical protein [Lentzea flava]MCP2201396.1 hypothetical protein [Lentzea flava]GGU51343.1 hypothetical protein GCM10010178_50240 [Lentzea flava]
MPRRDDTTITWARVEVSAPALDRYLEQLAATHVNGGYLIGRWRAVEHPGTVVRVDSGHLRSFFDDQVVRDGLSELRIPAPLTDALGFEPQWAGSLCLDGVLAGLIVTGGAYERYKGPAAEAKALAVAAVEALTQNRFADFRVDISTVAWTPWFYDIAWDHTLVLTDLANAELTVLCITDTD